MISVEKPQLVSSNNFPYVGYGNPLTLTCNFIGNTDQELTYSFYKDDNLMTSQPNNADLTFDSLNFTDAGQWTCAVNNRTSDVYSLTVFCEWIFMQRTLEHQYFFFEEFTLTVGLVGHWLPRNIGLSARNVFHRTCGIH